MLAKGFVQVHTKWSIIDHVIVLCLYQKSIGFALISLNYNDTRHLPFIYLFIYLAFYI